MCCLFVHLSGTTGQHARERREHVHARRCAQCGVTLAPETKVAAHVHARPCGLARCGFATLRSTCKACNHAHSKRRPRHFWGCKLRLRRLSCEVNACGD